MIRSFAIIVLLSLMPVAARAQAAPPPAKLVHIRLMPEKTDVKPGESVTVGIEETIEPGWHTYWKNPGDSGTAPNITWVLPPGFEIGPIDWPAPHKISLGNMVNYGYADKAVLLQKLKIPATATGPIRLKVGVEVLVCKDICIPESDTYELALNDGENENNEALIADARRALPEPVSWPASFEEFSRESDKILRVKIPKSALPARADLKSAAFFPEEWGLVVNAAPVEITAENDTFILSQARDQRSLAGIDELKGVLTFGAGDKEKSYAIAAKKELASIYPLKPAEDEIEPIEEDIEKDVRADVGTFTALLAALLGGIILNLMPCVFPVLSIKALSLVKLPEKEQGRAQAQGLSYTAGVVLSFILIAAALIALRAGGSQIGWGFQLQNPVIVTVLAYLLFLIGLNLAGLFEIPPFFANAGGRLAQGQGVKASFFTGVLAALVATPCTAPFMGVAVGAALTQPPSMALLIFAALGFGLALPYLALCFAPSLQRMLPRPGPWMEIFRQLLAFPMFASCAWLVWVVSQQAGPMAVLGSLMGLVALAFGVWLMSHEPESGYWRVKTRILAVVSIILAIMALPAMKMDKPETGFGEPWSRPAMEKALKGSDPVFVEMTAAWCITCKVNHGVAIDRDATRKLFAERRIKYFVGDWTNQDPAITKYINSYGRNGVPLYVFYGPRDGKTGKRPKPHILPQILTPGVVADETK